MPEQYQRPSGLSRVPSPALRPNRRLNPLRSFAATVCGMIAVLLIGLSIAGVWFERTVSDTSGYVRTVAPLAKDPAVKEYITNTASNAIIASNELGTVAPDLIRVAGLAGVSRSELDGQLATLVRKNVERIVNAPAFQQSWESVNRTAHDDITGQLKAGSTTISTNISPFVDDALKQFESAPQLAPYKDRIIVPEEAGKFSFSAGWLGTVGDTYRLVPLAVGALLFVAVVFTLLSVVLASGKLRALWLILACAGLGVLLFSTFNNLPPPASVSGISSVAQPAAEAFGRVFLSGLSHTLQMSGYILVAISVVVLGIDMFRRIHHGHSRLDSVIRE